MHDRAVDQGQRQIAHVDGQADALGEVQARLAAAQLGLVGDVVVDEGGGVEVLDGCRRARRALHVAAHRQAGREADQRTMALAAVFAVRLQGIVEVAIHIGMRARGKVGVHQLPYALRVVVEIFLERSGRILHRCDDLVDVHANVSPVPKASVE